MRHVVFPCLYRTSLVNLEPTTLHLHAMVLPFSLPSTFCAMRDICDTMDNNLTVALRQRYQGAHAVAFNMWT